MRKCSGFIYGLPSFYLLHCIPGMDLMTGNVSKGRNTLDAEEAVCKTLWVCHRRIGMEGAFS
jgi:hypothetical protein